MSVITMMDIARKAKVSRPTVSLVLNGHASRIKISEKTRQLVLDTSKSLGYRRNEIARSMVTGKTNFIGFIGDLSFEYCAMVLRGVVDKAESLQYYVKIFSNIEAGCFEKNLSTIMEQRPAGIIFRTLSKERYDLVSRVCQQFETPFAVVGSSFPGSCGIRINSDDEKGAAMAVKYLAGLGHKRIAHISAGRSSGYVELRRLGFLSEMADMGLTVPEDYLIHDEQIDNIEQLAINLLSTKRRPTAIFCGSDPYAMVVMRAVRKVGLKIPDDVSVIGYANLGYAKLSDPPLTTVAEPFDVMGQLVASELINEIEQKEKLSFSQQVEKIVDVDLVIRESTGQIDG